MNFMPQIGIGGTRDGTSSNTMFLGLSPNPQRRHTIVDHNYHPHFREYDGSGSVRNSLNEIHMAEIPRAKSKHSRNPSTATTGAVSCNIGFGFNNNNGPHSGGLDVEGEVQHPLLTLPPNDHDVDRASSYGKSLLEHLPLEHDCQLEDCQRVIINVSGLKFETQLRTLNRLPNTLLGDPNKRKRFWDEARQEFFFDRHRPTFQAVLYYYQSGGRLKKPLEVPMDIFLNELQFYELGAPVISCFKETEGYIMDTKDIPMPETKWKRFIWEAVEYPESSLLAKVFAVFSICFILVSVVTFCVETLPQFENSGCENVTVLDAHGNETVVTYTKWLDPLYLIESCCIAFFVIELILRFLVCPSKMMFVKNSINWIDLLAITPYFVFLGINLASGTCNVSSKSSVLSVLRVIRVVRILKLSKHSEGLKILGKTMKTSIRELSMFILFLGIATVIFSGAIFYAEMGESGSMFTSIPDAFWWAIVTMTTVGYGDYVPVGVFGKMLGGFCVLSGVLAIALPVPVIVANFNNFYRHYTDAKKKRRIWGHLPSETRSTRKV
ncbi:potassium voltage-gated channel subfamily A member 7 isoform X2 [Aplysia californica]|uniref:Potassium voltage-gated channel subfamily A member 7 isoform X2 n=1 Tax=Aplysia californica TaxID=6500 RepID=A0ABM0JQR2_APLCA|nr:potassium voltage-gated channel subfamily A member 7 isoform X2 [Aplysia californica]